MKYVLYLFCFFAALMVAGFIAGKISALKAGKSVIGNASDETVKQLARNGQTIAAIKMYRDLHGCGLKEAKDAVDALSKL